MNIIIPMAGRGSRLRPHTLTTPKPLVPIAGKPMVQRIVEDLIASSGETPEEIAFVIGDFGDEVEKQLLALAKKLGSRGRIYHQEQPLGTAHAILCAEPSLQGSCLVAFADTLFHASFRPDPQADGTIWVKKVQNPESFGVVKTDEQGYITEFVEKSPVFVSDLAIVGIYHFRQGEVLRDELQYLIDNDIKDKGEYQITNALENFKNKGAKIKAAPIEEWLDCGNKESVVATNSRILELKQASEPLISAEAQIEDSILIPPCYIGPGVHIRRSVIGPGVSIGAGSRISDAVLEHCLIGAQSVISQLVLKKSMVGQHARLQGQCPDLSVGDYTALEL